MLFRSDESSGIDLAEDIDYSVNWVDQTITPLLNVGSGDIINITVYEAGGGNQLYRNNYAGTVTDHVIIPVNNAEIVNVATFLNGESITGITWEPYIESVEWNILDSYSKFDNVNDSGNFYRALQDVPSGIAITNATYWFAFVPTLETKVDFNQTFTANDGIALVALGLTTVDAGHFAVRSEEHTSELQSH